MPVSGALTQLAAQGPQNRYLTVDPQITFFKGTYKRHSMFSMVEVENTFSGATGAGRKLTATIARSGDLVAQCYFYTELGHIKYASDMVNDGFVNNSAYYTNSVGHAMIETVGIDIGGNTFDEHTGEFLEIWERLTSSSGKRLGQMVGYAETTGQLIEYGFQTQHLYYHEAKLTVRTRALDKLIVRSGEANNPATLAMPGEISNMLILVNYIFLDTLERRMFAQQMHEYLIDQVQFTGAEPHTGSTSQAIRLQFNHPVKEIFG
ncbi:major capsid protein, partial [Acanthamoeba castellanii str. Neff]